MLVSQSAVSLDHRFYWCGLAFWLIGELLRGKAIFSLFLVCVELLHGFDCGFFVQCEMVTGHQC